jgi:glycosyltransferase involved in cell wall biosynthesis
MPENLAPYLPGYSHLKPVYDTILWFWMLETFNRLNAVIVPSKTAASLLQAQKLRPPVFAISGGIRLERFYPNPSLDRAACRARYGLRADRTLFLFVGRLDEEKRLDVILRAVHKLGRDDIQLCIAGHGAAQARLKTMAEALNLGQQVRFTGFVPNADLPDLINSCDIFVMPGEAELLSIASLEAMACGRPVLAANAVALPELVSDGLNGYLFKPGDASNAARGMEKLADHPELWVGMGAASLERALPHSLEAVMKRNEALYEMILTGRVATELETPPAGIRKKKSKESQHTSSV